MTQVPWWGVPLVTGLFALGGVLVAQVVIVRLDRLRIQREDSRRWLSERRRIYASLLAAAEAIYARLKQGWHEDGGISEYRDDLTSLHVLCQEVRLMSAGDVNAAAWRVSEKLGEVVWSVEARRERPLEKWKTEYKDAVGQFVAIARADLTDSPDGKLGALGRR
ncbi:hypothetical protein [Actinoplanes couchii]|uniref:Secreted protein n=1 Tax=Actinoplanes couchii TaxID=403638 RepID=A0ABQ3XQ56_9ACTN|nr:hypothetical protein [Actinoplanes couchii]MDR6322961.1 hypothetical protein [Actinoplanes couchii]GID60636.1 hypothetical protein Aco03nite_090400 [Actinoplanes couchii]